MKILKKILSIIVALVALLLVVSLFLPSKYHVERSLAMRAKPEAIIPFVVDLRLWPSWTAWNTERDPTLTFDYSGSRIGVGATSSWNGKQSGTGTMTITSADPRTGAKYDLNFEHGKYLSKGAITLEPAGDATKVVWTDDGDLGWSPIGRYFGLLMDKYMGPDFEAGLQKLKQKVETKNN